MTEKGAESLRDFQKTTTWMQKCHNSHLRMSERQPIKANTSEEMAQLGLQAKRRR